MGGRPVPNDTPGWRIRWSMPEYYTNDEAHDSNAVRRQVEDNGTMLKQSVKDALEIEEQALATPLLQPQRGCSRIFWRCACAGALPASQ